MLVLVIMAIIVFGIDLFVLSGIANIMQFESNDAYLNACRRNLVASDVEPPETFISSVTAL